MYTWPGPHGIIPGDFLEIGDFNLLYLKHKTQDVRGIHNKGIRLHPERKMRSERRYISGTVCLTLLFL